MFEKKISKTLSTTDMLQHLQSYRFNQFVPNRARNEVYFFRNNAAYENYCLLSHISIFKKKIRLLLDNETDINHSITTQKVQTWGNFITMNVVVGTTTGSV